MSPLTARVVVVAALALCGLCHADGGAAQFQPATSPSLLGLVVLHDRATVPTTEVVLNDGQFRTYTTGNGTFAFASLPDGESVLLRRDRGGQAATRPALPLDTSPHICCCGGRAGKYSLQIVSPTHIFSTVCDCRRPPLARTQRGATPNRGVNGSGVCVRACARVCVRANARGAAAVSG